MIELPKILRPICILQKIKAIFWVWFLFVIIVGQFGIIASIAYHFKNYGFCGILTSLIKNLNSGNFYTFSIALLASSLGAIFIDYLLNKNIKFKEYKVVVSAFVFLVIIFMGLFYSFLFTHESIALNFIDNTVSQKKVDMPQMNFDILQFSFFIMSVLLSIYIFCLGYLHLDYDSFKELDDSIMDSLKKHSIGIVKDGKGNRV